MSQLWQLPHVFLSALICIPSLPEMLTMRSFHVPDSQGMDWFV
jgi:hypothetical protein